MGNGNEPSGIGSGWIATHKPDYKPETTQENIDTERTTEQFKFALNLLMERTNNNPELAGAISKFITSIETRAFFGQSDQQIHPHTQAKMIDYFNQQAENLNNL
jgi:hypothetical protein